MTKLTKVSLWVMVYFSFSVIFGVIWSRNPHLFPELNLSDEAWLKIIETTGANKSNAEIVAALIFGAIISGALLVTFYVLRMAVKWLTKSSSGR